MPLDIEDYRRARAAIKALHAELIPLTEDDGTSHVAQRSRWDAIIDRHSEAALKAEWAYLFRDYLKAIGADVGKTQGRTRFDVPLPGSAALLEKFEGGNTP